MNLVHPDGFDPAQFPVRPSPTAQTIPPTDTPLPNWSGTLAPFPASSACQEPHHGARHGTLAVAPGNMLDDDPVLGTLHPPRRVAKMGGDSPQRHEEPAPLGQAVIARRRFLTTRTAPAYAGMRLYGDRKS